MKILYIVKNLRLANGVSTYAMNYYRKLRKTTDTFDFLVMNDIGSPYYKEITDDGNRVILAPSYRENPLGLVKFLKSLLTAKNYDIVHCHVVNSGALILALAKIGHIPVRILHAHATQNGDTGFKRIRNRPFEAISLACANQYIACSNLAGKSLFGSRKFDVVRNALPVAEFAYSELNRVKLRKNLDKLIIGTVGRFTEQKNPYFQVDIVNELVKKQVDFEFWWFGDGQLFNSIQEYAKSLGDEVFQHIVFWGAVSDMSQYYSAMDCFILPSLYEGLPVVGIEAQFAGLPCILSNKITPEASISDGVYFLDLGDAKLWTEKIIEVVHQMRDKNLLSVNYDAYDINNQAKHLRHLYEGMLRNN